MAGGSPLSPWTKGFIERGAWGAEHDAFSTRSLRQPTDASLATEPSSKAPSPPTGKPSCAGLHKLGALTGELAIEPLAGVDFSTYQKGMNNRALYGAIVRDLEKTFGVEVNDAYGKYCESMPGKLYIGEAQLDDLLAPLDSADDKKAAAAFVIAHEYFHVLLRHPQVVDGDRPDGFSLKKYSGYQKILEMQADYLAGRYIMARGLSLDAVEAMMAPDADEPERAEYPSGADRLANIASARQVEFRSDLFVNDLLDCLAFLDFIATGNKPA